MDTAPAQPSPFASAAAAVWITAAAQVVVFGVCSLLLALAAMTPAAQWPEMDIPGGVEQVRQFLWVIAILMAAVMWLPGLALLFLGFGVKEGRPGHSLAALVILLVQGTVLGLMGLLSVVSGLVMGQLLEMLLSAVVYGLPLALVIWAAVRVAAVRRALRLSTVAGEEPWNSHLGDQW